ncbi:MAG: glycosyltransferase family 2 protein [Bacteroidales bacterium]
MPLKKLSVVIPVYNEAATVQELLKRVAEVQLPENITKELVIVNDSSTDNTLEKVNEFAQNNPDAEIHIFSQQPNQGKGAALHRGIKEATGGYLVIQDADLEYDPEDYLLLLKPVLEKNADVVYGSRFLRGSPHRVVRYWHSMGNKFLTWLSNMFSNLSLTDMETCYKLFRSDIIKQIKLKEKRFGFEPEVTAKLAKIKNLKIYETGISYHGRSYESGKKINWKDGVRAIYCILKYNIF